MYLLREMSGHKVKKNTLYFEVRQTIYLFSSIDVYGIYIGSQCGGLKALNPDRCHFLIALRISLFLQTHDYTVG